MLSTGFASDLIVSARVITADGTLLDVDETSNADLLYALRGAGQYFGLITQLTILTFFFEEPIGDPHGKMWSGRFIFPLNRAKEVYETMRDHVVSNDNYSTGGLIMIGAPPPARKPGLAVLPSLIGKNPSTTQREAFKPLYDLGPLLSGGGEVSIQNNADALDPLCASGGHKKLVLTGLYELDPELLVRVVAIWQELIEAYPDAIGSCFSFQWHSRSPKKPSFESANSMHGIRFWANNMIWATKSESVDAVKAYLDRAIETLRISQSPDDYVDFSNSVREGPIERRYRGKPRLEKLRALKRQWDPEGCFGKEFL